MALPVLQRAAVVLTICCIAGAATQSAASSSLQRVEFPGAAQPPEMAQREGEQLKSPARDTLYAYLAKPEGRGPYAVVIALHGCGGPDPKRMKSVSDALVSWGYVALFVDSFSPRGIYHLCMPDLYAAQRHVVAKRPFDALAGLEFLAGHSYADTRRAAVVGFSQGAETALILAQAHQDRMFPPSSNLRFLAAAAFYPPCRRAGARPTMPTHIAIGALDDWTPAADCERLVEDWGNVGAPVELAIYPGAYHAFDAPMFEPGKSIFGHWIEYHPRAAESAYRKLRDFLARHLGG